jgi:REP element-mobilizing transposase RayT
MTDPHKKFKNKYRIASSRLQSWDYCRNGAYFITICTENRKPFLGNVKNGIMQLSHIGILADVLWHEIKNHAKKTVLADYVVMPNHVHGILIMDNDKSDNDNATPPQSSSPNKLMSVISPKPGSISTIVRSYKSAVTKHTNRLGYEFMWQTRFHDHIIRNEESFRQISEYIKTNPQNWKYDKFYTGD